MSLRELGIIQMGMGCREGVSYILTKDEISPGGAFPSDTALVQVEKVRG